MEFNVILAGVGGQGILTMARALSRAAMRLGSFVKQAELHGMAQRGGAVQAHLRIADHEIFVGTIPLGRANMILAAEPLEALRYLQYLAEDGVIVANTAPVVNIPDYGPVETTLDKLSEYPRHVLVDADRWASAAGAPRAMNMILLGAASVFLDIAADDLEAAIAETMSAHGRSVVERSRRAFQFGRQAAQAYREALLRGANPRHIREWLGALAPAELAIADPAILDGPARSATSPTAPWHQGDALSPGETAAIDAMLRRLELEGRAQLYEHEVYQIFALVGAISPPQHLFVPFLPGAVVAAGVPADRGTQEDADFAVHSDRPPGSSTGSYCVSLTPEALSPFRADRLALKVVSPDIVHKSEADAVAFVPNDPTIVAREYGALVARQTARTPNVAGVLIVEYVDHAGLGFGRELFVGIRATREFGPVIAAGLGGVQTEYFAAKLRPGVAVAKALADDTSAERFLDLFKKTAAYDVLAGKARGHRRIVADGELLRCFRVFLAIARRFCRHRPDGGPELEELEVNPFAFRRETLVPLDGRGRLGRAAEPAAGRNLAAIDALLEPKSIAILGVSGKRENFGRIILNNTRRCGFPRENLYVVKAQADPIDGVRCVPGIADLPDTVDLLIMAAAPKDAPGFVEEVIAGGKTRSVILIPGGMGETEGTESVPGELARIIASSRQQGEGGPVFLGGNCLGVRSRPGRYDTFFIPRKKLDPMADAPPGRCAIVAQSGGFIITRLSNWERLNPAFSISIGNQVDLTASDLLCWLARRDDVDAIGIYVEGFKDLDGLRFARMVRAAADAGKTVVFYKAGRTPAGRSASAGHTASIAGDYDVCQAAVEQAGAIVTETFKEFEQVMELATRMHDKHVGGRRLGVISNAGFETVGMADAVRGPRYEVEMAALSESTLAKLRRELRRCGLEALVNARNPLDLTPMAADEAYERCVRLMLDDPNVDAVIAAVVPMTPEMKTTPDEILDAGSIARRLPALFREARKPLAVVVDCGPPYDALARGIRAAGVPVFPSSDQAVRSLGRYLCHRAAATAAGPAGQSVEADPPKGHPPPGSEPGWRPIGGGDDTEKGSIRDKLGMGGDRPHVPAPGHRLRSKSRN